MKKHVFGSVRLSLLSQKHIPNEGKMKLKWRQKEPSNQSEKEPSKHILCKEKKIKISFHKNRMKNKSTAHIGGK